jgi:undecaprenyl pyrophosphate phosphatase UppP
MRDLLLQCAGILAIVVAFIHGILGETKVFARARIEPERLRTLIRLVWQASTVAWIGCGVLLVATPWMDSVPARRWIVITMVCVFGFSAIANAWATRGRHFGWMALSAVVAMAVAGY